MANIRESDIVVYEKHMEIFIKSSKTVPAANTQLQLIENVFLEGLHGVSCM